MNFFNLFSRQQRGRKTVPFEELLPLSVCSREYLNTVLLWEDIYKGKAPWLNADGCGLNLASAISSEIARLVTSEADIKISGSESADVIERLFSKTFLPRLRTITEYSCACGGVMLKPRFDEGQLGIDVILPDSFIPTKTDCCGRIIGACFIDRFEKDGKLYIRLEEHTPKDGGYLITNKAFICGDANCKSKSIPLGSVGCWKRIIPSVFIDNLKNPLFSYFSIPLGNTESLDSPLGISVFARAVPLIREADRQFSRLIWEFEGSELAIDASEDAFKLDRDGSPVLPEGKERLFRPNKLDSVSGDETFKVFSPQIRDESLINGLNRIIMSVEDLCGIARGTFSDPVSVSKTATEIRSMRQRTYVTVKDIQNSLKNAILRLIEAIHDLIIIYGIAPEGKIEADICFGDSVLTDDTSDRASDLEEVKAGVMTAAEFRKKWQSSKNQSEALIDRRSDNQERKG